MTNQKRCIIHFPFELLENRKSGSSVRPFEILTGFKEAGYDIYLIEGNHDKRQKAIKELSNLLDNGATFDFMYSETSTMPTLLTEKNHLPKLPFIDYQLFKMCKKNKIKIGIFYRDIYWKYPVYREQLSALKYWVAKFFYKLDLRIYKKYINTIFLPSKKVQENFPFFNKIANIDYLPPGSKQLDSSLVAVNKDSNKPLTIFYVGGISGNYDIRELLRVGDLVDNIRIIVCCRKEEWEKNSTSYHDVMNDSVEIIHEFNEGLSPYYEEADIFSCFFGNNEYMDMAMPVKLFQYLSYTKPIIGTENTATGDFIKENQIGWVIPNRAEELVRILRVVENDRNQLKVFNQNLQTSLLNNTWRARVEYVAEKLS